MGKKENVGSIERNMQEKQVYTLSCRRKVKGKEKKREQKKKTTKEKKRNEKRKEEKRKEFDQMRQFFRMVIRLKKSSAWTKGDKVGEKRDK